MWSQGNGLLAAKQSLGTKTPCWMANDIEGQEKQRDYIIQKANILCFQGLTALFAAPIGERHRQHVRPLPHQLRPQLSRPRRLSLKSASAKYKQEGTRNESVDVIPEMILDFVKFSFHLISG